MQTYNYKPETMSTDWVFAIDVIGLLDSWNRISVGSGQTCFWRNKAAHHTEVVVIVTQISCKLLQPTKNGFLKGKNNAAK